MSIPDNVWMMGLIEVNLSLVGKGRRCVHGDIALLKIIFLSRISHFISCFSVDFLIFKNGFHGLEFSFHLGQVLGGNLVDMALFIVCDSIVDKFIRGKEFRNGSHKIWRMKVILTQIILKFIETVLKREFVKNVFVLQKLGKELILHLWLVLIGIEELI